MSLILSIGTANPSHRHKQDEILGFMKEIHSGDTVAHAKLTAIYRKSNIESRYSSLPDYSEKDRSFFPRSDEQRPFPGLSERMRHFNREALPLSVKAIESCFGNIPDIQVTDITHLITVTCTGLSAPGLDIEIARHFKLSRTLQRTSVNFMGCYAAIHALKIADMICQTQKNAKVLVVCTELCTAHFQRFSGDDHLIANSLFADGSAAVLLTTDAGRKGFRLKGFYSEIEYSAFENMAWEVSETGFIMTLSSYIPKVIENNIADLFSRAMAYYGINRREIRHWAIHPGGKRILEVASRKLCIPPEDMQASVDVLRNYGNMSSPTILFVLKEIMTKDIREGENIFGVAFGPGLALETLLLTYS